MGCLTWTWDVYNLEVGVKEKMWKTTHGLSHTVEYRTWHAMLQRCQNSSNSNYKRYGGRGIAVCERWQLFENFYADMGPRPSAKHSIDRRNNNGNYEPDNCHWATAQEQARNSRRTCLIEWRGEIKCLADWCLLVGFAYSTVQRRLSYGWSVERALTTKPLRRVKLQPVERAELDSLRITIMSKLRQDERLGFGAFHLLARLSGLSRSTVSGVLQGKRGASLETLRKLSEASGVELGKLAEYVESQRKGRIK